MANFSKEEIESWAQDQTFETDSEIFRINELRDSAIIEEQNRRYAKQGFPVETKPEGYVIGGDPVPMQDKPRFDSNNRVFYSGRRPDGKGKITAEEYDPEVISLYYALEHNPLDTATAIELQEKLFKIGYLDNLEDIDGQYGPITKGAAHRYKLNKPGVIERVLNWWSTEDEEIF